MNNEFRIEVKDNQVKISFPEEFRSLIWSTSFGSIQKIIDDKIYNGTAFNTLIIDMSNCVWVDPVPMLSLLISLKSFMNDTTSVIYFYIPQIDIAAKPLKSHNAFLAFLAQEGFIDELRNMGVKIFFINLLSEISEKDYSDLNGLNTVLNYNNCHVLPAKIKDLKELTPTEIEDYAADLIDEIDNAVYAKVPNYAANIMYMKLYQILFETIDNVHRHAYPSCKNKCVGLYIRYRNGLSSITANSLNEAQKKRVSILASSEEKNNPSLSREMIDNSEGFFEIIVVDSGVGLKGTIKNPAGNPYTHPFFGRFQQVFFNRKRNNKTAEQTTAFGGLDLLSQMLRVENDFIHAHEGNEWIGFHSSSNQIDMSKGRHHTINAEKPGAAKPTHVKGLTWTFRLSWKNNAVRNQPYVFYSENVASEHPVYRAFIDKSSITPEQEKTSFYIDQREDGWNNNKFFKNQNLSFCDFYWLPDEVNTKNDIINSLDRYVKTLEFCTCLNFENVSDNFYNKIRERKFDNWFANQFNDCTSNIECFQKIIDKRTDLRILSYSVNEIKKICLDKYNKYPLGNDQKRTLIILDVPSYELVIYKNSLEHTTIKQDKLQGFNTLFDSLIICSRHYEVVAFSIEKNGFKLNNELAKSFFKCSDDTLNIAYSALWLRYHDSIGFWETLVADRGKSLYYTNAEIQWKVLSPKINGYLHFDNIIGHPKLFNYLKLAIDRTIGFFPNKNATFCSNDFLVHQIIGECNITNNTILETKNKISVDSVFATGLTASSASQFDEDENLININIFSHPDMEVLKNDNNDVFAQYDDVIVPGNISQVGKIKMLLWPNKEWINRRFPFDENLYTRIGNTPFIEKGDESTHVIKRNFNSDVYQSSLSDTYKDIQMRGFNTIRIGHHEYDGAHNFFDYNLQNIIENSKRSRSGVFPYLLKIMFFSLLENDTEKYMEDMLKEVSDDWRPTIEEAIETGEDNWGRVSVIIYPNHHYTSLLIRDITECLPDAFAKRFILVNTLTAKRKNGLIIPPSSIQLIKDKLSNFSHLAKDILIFDTIIESGRTRKVLKHILLSNIFNSAWVDKGEIKALSIIDSYRLPYSEPQKDRHKAYWRFDIPRLGNSQACALCSALIKATEIKNEVERSTSTTHILYEFLNNEQISSRIEEWRKSWNCVSSLNHVTGHGIDEAVVDHINTEVIDNKFAPVIKTNVGLAVYSAEMQSIQLRDNVILDIVAALESNNNHEQIVLVISNNLLLYGEFASQTLHIKLLCKLICAASKIEMNNYSSLAALTLLAQNEKYLEQAILSCLNNWQEDNFENYDLNIVLSHLAQKFDSIYLALPARITHPFDNKSRKEAYERLHFELYNDNGIIHINALEEACGNGFTYDNENSINLLHDVKSSLQMILKSISNIEECEYTDNSIQTFVGFSKLIQKIQEVCDDISIFMYGPDSTDVNIIKKVSLDILQNIRGIHQILKEIHNGVFIAYGLKEENNILIKKISKIITKSNKAYVLKKDSDIHASIIADGFSELPETDLNEVWYYWNSDIEQELRYLLSNVRHCTGDMLKTNYGEKAHMLVSVNADLDYCTITMRNVSDHDWNYVLKQINKKCRLTMVRNKKLGIVINGWSESKKDDISKYELTMEMKIPAVKLLLEGKE